MHKNSNYGNQSNNNCIKYKRYFRVAVKKLLQH